MPQLTHNAPSKGKLYYEYLKKLLKARMQKHHFKHTLFLLFFLKTSLTNEEIAKRNRINFTGGAVIVYYAPSSYACTYICFLSLSVSFYHAVSAYCKTQICKCLKKCWWITSNNVKNNLILNVLCRSIVVLLFLHKSPYANMFEVGTITWGNF